MLIVNRKQNEKVTIGEAEVTILRFERGRVVLGIQAPKHVKIDVHDKKPMSDREKAEAIFNAKPTKG